MADTKFYTRSELADYIGCHPRDLIYRITAGQILKPSIVTVKGRWIWTQHEADNAKAAYLALPKYKGKQ